MYHYDTAVQVCVIQSSKREPLGGGSLTARVCCNTPVSNVPPQHTPRVAYSRTPGRPLSEALLTCHNLTAPESKSARTRSSLSLVRVSITDTSNATCEANSFALLVPRSDPKSGRTFRSILGWYAEGSVFSALECRDGSCHGCCSVGLSAMKDEGVATRKHRVITRAFRLRIVRYRQSHIVRQCQQQQDDSVNGGSTYRQYLQLDGNACQVAIMTVWTSHHIIAEVSFLTHNALQ